MQVIIQYKTLPENELNTEEVSTLNKKLIDWASDLQNFNFFGSADIEPKNKEIVIEVSYKDRTLTWQILTEVDEQSERYISDKINIKR